MNSRIETTSFKVLIPLTLVRDYAVAFMNTSVYESYFDVLGFRFHLHKDEIHESIVNVEDSTVKVTMPVKFTFVKSEGLFSVSGGGALVFKLSLQFKSEYGNIAVCSHLDNYTWTETPSLHMGVLSFPLEFIANQVIDTFKIKYLRSFDDYFNQKNLFSETAGTLLQQYGNQLKILNTPELYFHTKIEQITFGNCKEENGYLSTPLQISCTNTISDRKEYFNIPDIPTFHIMTHRNSIAPSPFSVDLECKYATLAKYLKHTLQNLTLGGKDFEVSNINIQFRDQLLFDVSLTAPISGKCKFYILPEFKAKSETIDIKHLHVDIQPESFLYKLTAPLLEKFLVTKIKELFPLDISKAVFNMVHEALGNKKNKKLRWQVSDVHVDQLTFNTSGIQLSVSCHEWFFENHEKGITIKSALG